MINSEVIGSLPDQKKNAKLEKRKKTWREIKRDKFLYLMILPFILYFVIFQYKPMWGIQIAFKDFSLFKGISASPWVGLQHFKDFVDSEYFFRNFKNTIIINLYSLFIGFPIPIILAILVNELRHIHYKKLVQTLTYLPHFISGVVVAGMVISFLSPSNGVINIFLERLGFEKQYFLIKPEYFRGIFTGMHIWKNAGFSSIVFLSAISGVDQELYETAHLDGANKFQEIIHVTVPSILPTIIIMLIMRIGHLLSVGFEQIILLYQPATYSTADVISTYVYRSGLEEGQYDFATAVGLFNAIISFVLVWTANRISKKVTKTSLW